MIHLHRRVPCILIASHGEWVGRSMQSVLELNGYVALRVESGRRALELARGMYADGLILDSSLEDLGGIEVCRMLHDDPLFDQSAPIFITAPAPVSHLVRTAAYEAGCWDFCGQPLDVETLLLKLGTYLRARLETVTRGSELLDPATGVYTTLGLQHWAEQLGARAARKHEPFACVAVTVAEDFTPPRSAIPGVSDAALVAEMCLAESRKSDVVAHVGEREFAILAPDTDGPGARGLVGRLQRAAERAASQVDRLHAPLQAGFYAVADFGSAGVPAIEVVRRAQTALRFAVSTGGGSGLLSFDDLPIN